MKRERWLPKPDCPHVWEYRGTLLTRGMNEWRCATCKKLSHVRRNGRTDQSRLTAQRTRSTAPIRGLA